MIVAAIGSVHGHAEALDRVLDAITAMGIEIIVQTGDLLCEGAESHRVIDAVRRNGVRAVLSEADRKVLLFTRKRRSMQARLSPEEFEMLRAAHESCRPNDLETLRSLPRLRTESYDGIAVVVAPANPANLREPLRKDSPEDQFARARETATAPILIVGGPAASFSLTVADTLIVHPGPIADGGAAYGQFALISTESEPWEVRFERVEISAE